jgi:hypothetical protein
MDTRIILKLILRGWAFEDVDFNNMAQDIC